MIINALWALRFFVTILKRQKVPRAFLRILGIIGDCWTWLVTIFFTLLQIVTQFSYIQKTLNFGLKPYYYTICNFVTL